MIRRFWLLAIFLLWVPSAHAGAPARLAVMLKEKMSCREVKRLLRIERQQFLGRAARQDVQLHFFFPMSFRDE